MQQRHGECPRLPFAAHATEQLVKRGGVFTTERTCENPCSFHTKVKHAHTHTPHGPPLCQTCEEAVFARFRATHISTFGDGQRVEDGHRDPSADPVRPESSRKPLTLQVPIGHIGIDRCYLWPIGYPSGHFCPPGLAMSWDVSESPAWHRPGLQAALFELRWSGCLSSVLAPSSFLLLQVK